MYQSLKYDDILLYYMVYIYLRKNRFLLFSHLMWIEKTDTYKYETVSNKTSELEKQTDRFRVHIEDLEETTIIEIVQQIIDLWWEVIAKLERAKSDVIEDMNHFAYRATLDYATDSRWFIAKSNRTLWYSPIFDGVKESVSQTIEMITDIIETQWTNILIAMKSLQWFMDELLKNEALLFTPNTIQQSKIRTFINEKFFTIKQEVLAAQEKITQLDALQTEPSYRKGKIIDITASEDMERLYNAKDALTKTITQNFLAILNESIWTKNALTLQQCEEAYKKRFILFQ